MSQLEAGKLRAEAPHNPSRGTVTGGIARSGGAEIYEKLPSYEPEKCGSSKL